MKWTKRITRFAIRNRKSPAENRKIVGKYISLLAVVLFAVFLVNFAVIIGSGSKFGTDLVKEAKKVHQITRTVPAKRGTIYDRNGVPIAEDATSYNVYAVIDKKYKSATGKILYVEDAQFNKVAEVFHKYLDMDETYVKEQLSQPNLTQVSFGAKGNGITYANMMAIKKDLKDALTNENANFPQLSKEVAEDEAEAILHTSQGDIRIKLFPKLAPLAVENFLTHAKEGYYNGVTFHRVIDGFMVQTGDPKGDGTGGE